MTVRSGTRARWRASVLLVVGITALGLGGTATLAAAVDREHADHLSQVMDQRTNVIESAVTSEVRRYVETSADLAASVGAQSDLSADDFVTLTSTLTRERFPGTSGVALVVPATDAHVADVQRQWRARGNHRLTLAPDRTGAEHLFVVLNHPLDGTAARTGLDLSRASQPVEALRTARTTGRVSASPTYVLLRDRSLPVAQQQRSFALAAPVYGGAGTPDAGEFRGWVLMALRGGNFLDETLHVTAQESIAVTLEDGVSSQGAARNVLVARSGSASAPPRRDLERHLAVTVAGRGWRLTLQPARRFDATAGRSLGGPTRFAGLLFTVLLAVLVGALSSSRNLALSRVDKATGALRADIARRELVESALLLREDELRTMALTDSLTGLANRRAFMEQLDRSHARVLRHGSRIAVLFCDVDGFKTINDTHGHRAGDGVLHQVASRLRTLFRAEDTIGRLGGDEFAIICENVTPYLDGLVERVQAALAAPYDHDGQQIHASVSVGMAAPRDGETSAHLLERADRTMYQAKAGRTASRH